MSEKRLMRVERIIVEEDRALLYGKNPDYHVIASADIEISNGDIIKYEPFGVNFGFMVGE